MVNHICFLLIAAFAFNSFSSSFAAGIETIESSISVPVISLEEASTQQAHAQLLPKSDTQQLFQANPLQASTVNTVDAQNNLFPIPEGGTLAPSNPNFAFYDSDEGSPIPYIDVDLINLVTGDTLHLATLGVNGYSGGVRPTYISIHDVSPDGKYVIYTLWTEQGQQAGQNSYTTYFRSITDPEDTFSISGGTPDFLSMNESLSFLMPNIAQIQKDIVGGLIRVTSTIDLATKEVNNSYALVKQSSAVFHNHKKKILLIPEYFGTSSVTFHIFDTSKGTSDMRLIQDINVSPPYLDTFSFVKNNFLGAKKLHLIAFKYRLVYDPETNRSGFVTRLVNGITGEHVYLPGIIRKATYRKNYVIYKVKKLSGKIVRIKVDLNTMKSTTL